MLYVKVYVNEGMYCMDIYVYECVQYVKCVFCKNICGACECSYIFLAQSFYFMLLVEMAPPAMPSSCCHDGLLPPGAMSQNSSLGSYLSHATEG